MGDAGLADWLGDTESEAAPEQAVAAGRRRAWRLILLALLPWIVTAVLAAALLGRSESAPSAGGSALREPAPAVSTAAAPVPTPVPQPPAAPRLHVPSAQEAARVEPAVRAALAAAHGALADEVVVEALEAVSGVHVARTWVLLVERVEGRWRPPRAARYAVPVKLTGHVAEPLGAPWSLPLSPSAPPRWEPVVDPTLTAAATAAIAEAGYRDVRHPRHERSTDLGVGRVSFRGRAPTGGAVVEHVVWITDEAVPRVVGTDGSNAATRAAQPGEVRHGG